MEEKIINSNDFETLTQNDKEIINQVKASEIKVNTDDLSKKQLKTLEKFRRKGFEVGLIKETPKTELDERRKQLSTKLTVVKTLFAVVLGTAIGLFTHGLLNDNSATLLLGVGGVSADLAITGGALILSKEDRAELKRIKTEEKRRENEFIDKHAKTKQERKIFRKQYKSGLIQDRNEENYI